MWSFSKHMFDTWLALSEFFWQSFRVFLVRTNYLAQLYLFLNRVYKCKRQTSRAFLNYIPPPQSIYLILFDIKFWENYSGSFMGFFWGFRFWKFLAQKSSEELFDDKFLWYLDYPRLDDIWYWERIQKGRKLSSHRN